MATTWDDLQSKSDIFNNLPGFNKDGLLEDTVEASLKGKVNNGKYDFKTTKVGDKLETKFSAKEKFTNYWNVETGVKLQSKPYTEFSIKFGEELLPLKGASLTVKEVGSEKEDSVSVEASYQCEKLDAKLGVKVNNPLRCFGLASEKVLAKNRPNLNVELLYNLKDDYFVGLKANADVPNEGEKSVYDGAFVVAVRNEDFEGGCYDKYEVVKKKDSDETEAKYKLGAWAAVQKGDLLLRAHVDKKRWSNDLYKGFTFTTGFVKTKECGSKLIGQVQVVPDTTVSLGYETKIGKAKVSLGYARILAFGKGPKVKTSSFKFGLGLDY